jgi:hypothetical protein
MIQMNVTKTVILISLMIAGCTKNVSETDGFVSAYQFSRNIGWAYTLPNDAQEVRARLESHGTQRNFLYLRFRMDLEKLPALLEEWAKDLRFAGSGNKIGSKLDITKANYAGATKRLQWWQPQKIVHGYYTSIPESGGLGIRIWVDSDTSVVYILDVA